MKNAVITGFGQRLSEFLARRLLDRGYRVTGLSRGGRGLAESPSGFLALACDVGEPKAVSEAFDRIHAEQGPTTLLIHNAAQLLLDDFMQTTPQQFESVWRTACLGGMLCTQAALPNMLAGGAGTLLFTGATASVKAGEKSAAFASAKFGLRGLAQALARQYGKQGIHVIHTVIDGVIWGERAEKVFKMDPKRCMDAEAIADAYLHLIDQPPSCWTHEIDLRPNVATF